MRRHPWLAVVIMVLIIAALAVAATARKSAAAAGPTRVAAKVNARYACPMHPEVTSPTRAVAPSAGCISSGSSAEI